jgi:signal recognition particle receptor subunit beta
LTRQLVLRGVDGIVFVADSQYEAMQENVESFADMENNLRALKLNLADIPHVLQYNKQDLPGAARKEYMDYLLNDREMLVPSFPAVATQSQGVFETLNAVARLLVAKYIYRQEKQAA